MSWTSESLQSIETFAKEVSQDTLQGCSLGPNERSMGSALELALALQHGTLTRLLKVAQQLFAQHAQHVDKNLVEEDQTTKVAHFPRSVNTCIQSIANREPLYNIDSFGKSNYLNSLDFSNKFNHGSDEGSTSIVGIAASNGYVYLLAVHDNAACTTRTCSLFKVGTGDLGTDKGRVYTQKQIQPLPSTTKDCCYTCGTLGGGRWFLGCLSNPNRLVVMCTGSGTMDAVACYNGDTLDAMAPIALQGGTAILYPNRGGGGGGGGGSSGGGGEEKKESNHLIEEKTMENDNGIKHLSSPDYDNYAMCTNGRGQIYVIVTPPVVHQNHSFTVLTYSCVGNGNGSSNGSSSGTLIDTVQLISQHDFKKDKKNSSKKEPVPPLLPAGHNAWHSNGTF